ncbi:hypothetical protein D3C85_1600990 [compost metagenome]
MQLSVGPERPADRAGGYATPWAPIYATPAAPQQDAVMPERKKLPKNYAEAPLMWSEITGWNACLDEVARLNPSAQGEKP